LHMKFLNLWNVSSGFTQDCAKRLAYAITIWA